MCGLLRGPAETDAIIGRHKDDAMDDLETSSKSDVLTALSREDLAPQSLDALAERIVVLQAEISRCQEMMDHKKGSRADAEAIFKS